VPAPSPGGIVNITGCTDPGAEFLLCNFANLTANISLNEPEQLRILQRDCGIISVTALKNGTALPVNVKDDPALSTPDKLVFIESSDGRGGCLTFQFNQGPAKQGIELFQMILNELDDGATVQVSRHNNSSLSVLQSQAKTNQRFLCHFVLIDY
jgi:hypothetical protein